MRWAQLGFGRMSTTSTAEQTLRDLFGFKDGTADLTADEAGALDDHLWVESGDGPAWTTGGSCLVARRIRMTVETWDPTSLQEQEQVIGRTKGEGAPLGRREERDELVPATLPATSHVALAHPSAHGGARCCAAATTSSTAPTGSGTSTPEAGGATPLWVTRSRCTQGTLALRPAGPSGGERGG